MDSSGRSGARGTFSPSKPGTSSSAPLMNNNQAIDDIYVQTFDLFLF
jgi:hypothetical protein